MRISLLAAAVVAAAPLIAVQCGYSNDKSYDYTPDSGTSGAQACIFDSDCTQGSCVNGVCVVCPATPCPAGTVCTANGTCQACGAGCDASVGGDGGSGRCLSRNDCPANEACISGVCQPPGATCANNDGCLRGQVCDQGKCYPGNCVANIDCNGNSAGPICNLTTHQCGPCTADSQCQTTAAPGNYCNTSTGQCAWGCLPSPNCASNCCTTGTCNTTTHQCATTCDCTTVTCNFGQTCDPTTCTCTGGSGGGDAGTTYCTAGCTCPNSQICLDLSFTGQCPNPLAFCF